METLIIILLLLIIYILNINSCKNELFVNHFDDNLANSDEESNYNYKYKFIIYTQNLGLLIAESIGHILKKLNYEYNIVLEITIEDIKKNRKEPNEIYIILFPHTLKNFPDVNKYIIYQLEQYKQSKWITNDYKKKIDNSIFTWEYSLENYNNFEPEYKKKLFYFPVPILNIVHNNIKKKSFKYDIIFVGAPNKRRTDIVKELKKKYKVLFLTKTFNNELYDKMEEAKIILNLHYYKNAILETTRINEALFNNKLVISEEPDEYDIFNKKLYQKNIIFIDEIKDDLSNINELYKILDNYLEDEKYYSKLLENNDFINKLYEYSFYFLYLSFKKNNLINKKLNYEFKNNDSILNDKIKYIKNIILLTSNYNNNKEDVEINNLNKIINKDYFDWYYFSNINNKISGWDVLNNDFYDKKQYKLDNNSKNQYLKTQALKLDMLNKYSCIIWIDNTYKINNNNFVNDIINTLENYPNNNLFVIDNHYMINEEMIRKLDINNDIKSNLLKQYDDYKPVILNKKIYSAKFFVYKNNKRVEDFFDEWWLECQKYDFKLNLSLALNYLLYKKNLEPVVIPNNIINNQNEDCNNTYNKINASIIKKLILNNNFNEIENLQIDFSKINFIDGIVWINSDKNKKREEYMKSLLKNISVKNYRISEIEGNTNIMDIFTNINFDRKLTNNEIAKTLSHIKAINFLEKIDGNYFLICEDNICLKNTVLFDKDLKTIIESSPKFDILMLNKNYLLNIEENYSKWAKYYKPIENEYVGSSSAYIISRDGINKFIKLAKYDDSYFKLDKKNNLDLADIYLYKYLDTLVYKYNYIGTKNIELINNQHQNEDKNNLFQLNIIIKDFHNKK